MDLDFSILDTLVDDLKDGGVRYATTNPNELNLPGVLVQVTGIDLDLLAGHTIHTRVLCVVGDTDDRPVLDELADLFNKVTAVIDPDDKTTVAQYPVQGQLMPCLAIPLDLHQTA